MGGCCLFYPYPQSLFCFFFLEPHVYRLEARMGMTKTREDVRFAFSRSFFFLSFPDIGILEPDPAVSGSGWVAIGGITDGSTGRSYSASLVQTASTLLPVSP